MANRSLQPLDSAHSANMSPQELFGLMWPEHKLPPRVNFRMGLALVTKREGKFFLWTPAEALAVTIPTWGVEFE